MSDMEDDFMCDDEEDYDLVRLPKINATVNACDSVLRKCGDINIFCLACL